MLRKAICVGVPRSQGEEAIGLLKKLKIFNNELKIQRNDSFIYIPLIKRPKKEKLQEVKKQITDSKILTCDFPLRKRRATPFYELLEKQVPLHLANRLPHSIDFIGDIAVIEIPAELEHYRTSIGEAILKTHIGARTVLAKEGPVHGTYRLRNFSTIAGERKTQTIHKEYGCLYHVDLTGAYFSPRLSHEHHRVASLVQEGEIIVDLFTGVGAFAILIAKTHKNVKVYAIDINPVAVELLKKNIRLNKVESRVHPIFGDAKHVIKHQLTETSDRAIMNLPEKAKEFIDTACQTIKPIGGTLHFYSITNSSRTIKDIEQQLERTIKNSGRKVGTIRSRCVRNTAPHEYQVAFDVKIC